MSSSSSLSSIWNIKDINGNIIWSSTETNLLPSSLELSQLLHLQYEDNDIHHITSQIIRNGPAKSIGLLLTCIACHNWRTNGLIDPMKINTLKNATPRAVCGKVFRKGDIVWTCRSCAKDATCVQCDDCFRNSNHEGHEVYFHRESEKEGGCCDCGDSSAWCKSGNCTKHSIEIDPNIDPLSIIPDGLMKSLKPVLVAVAGVISSYVTCIARGYQKVGHNDFLTNFIEENQKNRLVMRLHNDDIHTYEEVTDALIKSGELGQRAEQLTRNVDKAGEALIHTIEGERGLFERKWDIYHDNLSVKAGLLFSIIPEDVYNMGPKITSVLSWLQSIGTMNDGIKRLICQCLIIDVNDLPDCANAYPSVPQFTPRNIFSEGNKFPCLIQHLVSPATADFIKLDSNSYDLALRPFNTCHRNCLSLMIASSPYLSKSVKKALNDIVLVYQHDLIFKSAYSQSLTTLYPTLYFLFSKSVGTVENTIFNTTVQFYTSKITVKQMSSDGINERVLKQNSVDSGGSNVHITKILSETLRHTFDTVEFLGLDGLPPNDPYHLRLKNYCSALHQVCRDFEYCVEDPLDAIRVLSGKRDPGVVDDLLSIYAALESAHMHKRIGERERHVERESEKWQDYWKIIGDLESISTKLLNSAFFTQIPKHNISNSLVLQAEQDYDDSLQEALDQVTNKTLKKIEEWTAVFEAPLDEQFFKITDVPLNCLGHPITFRAYRRYQVSISPVSINLPLHHFLSKIITYSCYAGADLEKTMKIFSNYPDAVVSLADYPLRCLCFVSQVFSDMWRRNGSPTANICYLYQTVPYIKYNRDADIHAIQIAIAVAGPDSIISLAIDRFEVLSLLETKDYNNTTDPIKGSKGYLLTHLLRTLIHIATQTPFILDIIHKEKSSSGIDPLDIEGIDMEIRRECAHALLGGARSISGFSKLRGLIGSDTTVTDDLINSAVDELCNRRDMGEDRVSLEPKDNVFEIYDPEFHHLNQKQVQAALDTVKAYRKKISESNKISGKEDFDIFPIITPAAIRTPHPQLLCVRNFLYRPFTFSLLERSMRVSLDSIGPSSSAVPQNERNTCAIVSKVVHLITLQIYCFPDFKREICKGTVCYASAKYFNRNKSFVEESYDQVDIERNAEAEKKFILTLADVYLQGVVKSDDIYESGLKWVLRELFSYNEIVRNLLSAKNITFKSSFDENLEKKKQSAKDRMNAKMKAQIDSFNALMEAMSDDEEDDAMIDGTNNNQEEIPTCIVCRQNTPENVGYLSYLQASSILKQAITQNDDNQSQVMSSIYRVVALNGCDILKSNDNNAPVKHHLQQGEHILIASQVGKWLKVVAPIPGWCALYTIRNTEDSDSTDGVVAQLYPVKELQFNRFGPNRVHISACGHCMHRSCWETYHASSLSLSWNNALIGRNAIDVDKGELQCPLCKGITNSFVPYNSPSPSNNPSIKLGTESSLSSKLSGSYNWALLGDLLSSPISHNPGQSNNEKFFVDSCLVQLVPSWEEDVTIYMDIDEIATKRNLNTTRCIHSGWSAAAYTLMTATCNGRWIYSNSTEFLKADSTEMTIITQSILSLRQCTNWFSTLNDYNDFILNPLQRLISGSISSILTENFGGEESISALISAKGFRLTDAASCTLQDCYMTLLQMPSYSVSHPSLVPSKRLSMMLDLFHQKGVPEKYLSNFLHIPLLSHDLHVIAMAVITCISSVQSLDECVGSLCLARLAQILIEPASLGFIAINKSLKRERSDLPKTASWANESKLLSELRANICSTCKIPMAENITHEDELTDHIFNLWLNYLEYACLLKFVVHKIVEPTDQSLYESYASALNPSGTQVARINRILALFGIPEFNNVLPSIGMSELTTRWSKQFHSVSPETLDVEQIQRVHPIIPSSFDLKQQESSNPNLMDVDSHPRIEISSKLEMNYNHTISAMDENFITAGNQLLIESDGNGDPNDDDDDDDGIEMNNEIGDDNMQAIFESLLGVLQPPPNIENTGVETAAKWKLIGVYPTNKLVDEHLPGMFGEPVASFHSSTPLLGSISGTHVINGLNGERLEHVFPDMSQMGLSVKNRGGLIKLPSLYTDLYQICKNPEGPQGIIIDDPAVCLVCGRICSAGNRKIQPTRLSMQTNMDPGEATLHARECGAGVGVFFLAHKCAVLLIRGSRSMFYPSIYVDQNGESCENLHSNKPLFLNTKKYQKLEELYLKHQIGTEITRHRSTADRNIRANWY